MFFTLVANENDPASKTMSTYLQDQKKFIPYSQNFFKSSLYDNVSLYLSKTPLLHANEVDDICINTDIFVFLSKHQSKNKIPSLTCHFPGNFNTNCYGGNQFELGISYPSFQKNYIKQIFDSRPVTQYCIVTIETTHHGPTSLKKPVIFVEIGSTEEQWYDRDLASLVCESILHVVSNRIISQKRICIGIGGTHYGAKFNDLILNSDFSIGHIANKHNLADLTPYLLNQMILKSYEKVDYILIDNKGLGKEKSRIFDLIRTTGLEIIKI